MGRRRGCSGEGERRLDAKGVSGIGKSERGVVERGRLRR